MLIINNYNNNYNNNQPILSFNDLTITVSSQHQPAHGTCKTICLVSLGNGSYPGGAVDDGTNGGRTLCPFGRTA